MIKLAKQGFEAIIEIETDYFFTLQIENQNYFYKIANILYSQSNENQEEEFFYIEKETKET